MTYVVCFSLVKPEFNRGTDFALWSGEATRNQGVLGDANVNVNIGSDLEDVELIEPKKGPIWMLESTILSDIYGKDASDAQNSELGLSNAVAANFINAHGLTSSSRRRDLEDIMTMLLQYEAIAHVANNTQVSNTMTDSSESDDSMPEKRKYEITQNEKEYVCYQLYEIYMPYNVFFFYIICKYSTIRAFRLFWFWTIFI